MPGSWPPQELPNLTDQSCVITSPPDTVYNCIAWAAEDTNRWWWPFPLGGVSYWPKGIPRQETIDAFILAFGTLGFLPCRDGSLEKGVQKIVLFARLEAGSVIPTHAARQLENGHWTSKLGPLEDITHFVHDAVNGPAYGQAVKFLSRRRH
jgi:hypothetical protein